jgi:hypothetical protein
MEGCAENLCGVRISETGTDVTLLAIKDDFLERTLASIPGVLGKLDYVAELRENGRYVHWGLARIYGEEGAQRTMAEVHRGLFLQVLRMPVRKLFEDVKRSAAAQRCEVKRYLRPVLRDPRALMPANLGGGSEAHFNSVVAALLALLR